MKETLSPIITDIGFQQLFNAEQNGLQLELTQVGLGAGAYSPNQTQITLQQEQERIAIADGQVDSKTLMLNCLIQSPKSYWVRELGLYTDKGDLFAVWSHPDEPLVYKAADIELLLSFHLVLDSLPSDVITINGNTSLNLHLCEELANLSTATIATMNRQLRQEKKLLQLEIP